MRVMCGWVILLILYVTHTRESNVNVIHMYVCMYVCIIMCI